MFAKRLQLERTEMPGLSNTSPGSQRAIGFIYCSERAKEDVVARAAYQQKLAADLHESQRT